MSRGKLEAPAEWMSCSALLARRWVAEDECISQIYRVASVRRYKDILTTELSYLPCFCDSVRKKMENYAEIFGNITRKKVTIMRKRRQIMRKFLKLMKLFSWLFSTYKTHINVLPRISVLYDMFDLLLPFVDRYFFVQRSFSPGFSHSFRCRVCLKLSNQALKQNQNPAPSPGDAWNAWRF